MPPRSLPALAIRAALATARRLGAPRVICDIPAQELDAYAYATAYMLGARAWLLRQRAPSWRRIERAWAEAVGNEAVRAELSGTLDPRDTCRLVTDGDEAFVERSRLYAAARARVDIANYYVRPDDTGWSTAKELAACTARGVRVRLVVDHHMTERKRREVPGMDALFADLRRSGVEVRVWSDPSRPYDSTHRKIILVDDDVAVVGSRNIADYYRGGLWRDADLVVRGPSVAGLSALYEDVWRVAGGEATRDRGAPGSYRPWFDHAPATVETDPSMRYVLACIGAARRTVDAQLAYFVGQDVLCRAVVAAVARGVHVRLLTNDVESNDLPWQTYAAYAGMRRLLEGGAEVFARRGRGACPSADGVLRGRARRCDARRPRPRGPAVPRA